MNAWPGNASVSPIVRGSSAVTMVVAVFVANATDPRTSAWQDNASVSRPVMTRNVEMTGVMVPVGNVPAYKMSA